ncbi:MAG: MFS transporter [Syntrophobacteraceae bacterium]|nr:MFS transporter [Desulfobacteraceae bacterium]
MIRKQTVKAGEAMWPMEGRVAQALTAAPARIGTVAALFITGFATFLNVYVTQPLLPEFRQVFSASELLVSLTVSAPVLAVAMAAPLVGLMADAVGRKRVIVAAMLGLAVPSTLAATASDLGQLIVWRFLQGIFVPGIIAVTIAYISEESPRRSVGATMAVYVTGTVVGGFAGRYFAGIAATHWGWRSAFLGIGAFTLIGALATWWLLPRSTRFVRQNNAAAALRSMGRHLRNPQLLATYAVGFNVLFSMVAAFTYVNFYLADEPFSLGPAALATIFSVYLLGAVVTPVAGRLLDRIGFRRMLLCSVGLSSAGMLMTLFHYLPAVIAGLALEATGVFACQSASSGHVGNAAGEARSSAAGLYVTLYYFGGFAGSILPGFLWDRAGWLGCVALILCMQITSALIGNKLWKD